MGEPALLQTLGLMILAAAGMVLVARWLHVPTIVVYILTGLVLSPFLGWLPVGPDEPMEAEAAEAGIAAIAEVGIALLLFLVGLELSLSKIRDAGKVSLLTGLLQTLATAVVGLAVAKLLGFGWLASLFIATAMTNSSTVLVVKLLDQKRETNEVYGHIAVGANLVKDLFLVVVLAVLAGFAGEGGSTTWRLLLAGAGVAVMLAMALGATRFLLPGLFQWAARVPQTLFVFSLCWCFLFVLGAEFVGVSAAIGAFLAGLSLAQLPSADDLRRRVHPLVNFFLAVFFISVGIQIEVEAVGQIWLPVLVLSVFVLLFNPLVCMWLINWAGYGRRTGFLASSAMGQISELSFVFAAVGVGMGMLDERGQSTLTLVGLVTIAISAYLILYNQVLYGWVERYGLLGYFKARPEADEGGGAEPIRDHVIVVGMNALGRRLAGELHGRGEKVLAIDTDARKLANLPCRTLVGSVDYPAVLEEAGLARAKLVVSALQIEDTNDLLAYRCKEAGVPTAIHAFDRTVIPHLRQLGVDYLIDSRTQGRLRMHQTLRETGVVQS